MAEQYDPLHIPTSDWYDSYAAYDRAYHAPTNRRPEYELYDMRAPVPAIPSWQPAHYVTAPTPLRRNPDWSLYQPGPQPFQPDVHGRGAPPKPMSDPGYIWYQSQTRVDQSYQEAVLGGSAPSITAAIEAACSNGASGR